MSRVQLQFESSPSADAWAGQTVQEPAPDQTPEVRELDACLNPASLDCWPLDAARVLRVADRII